jgi:hypothetical protein
MGSLGHILFWCFDAVILTVPAAIWWEVFCQWRRGRRDHRERRSPLVTVWVDWGHLADPQQIIDDMNAAIAATMAVPAERLLGHQPPETDADYLTRILAAVYASALPGFAVSESERVARSIGAMGATGGMLIHFGAMQAIMSGAHSFDISAPEMRQPVFGDFGADGRPMFLGATFRDESMVRAAEAARDKSIALLKEWLTPVQRNQYDRENSFDVIGGDTGKRYRIMPLAPYNIVELDADDHEVARWCTVPKGTQAAGDVLLAQKIGLEKRETETLRIANRRGDGPADIAGIVGIFEVLDVHAI